MLKYSIFVLAVVLVVGAAAQPTNAITVPFKAGDINENGEVVVNTLWKTYYSSQKQFGINYYDSEFLYPQNITETGDSIRLNTLPMLIDVHFKRNLDIDAKELAVNMQIKDQQDDDKIVKGVHSLWVDDEIGYSYTKVTQNGYLLQNVFVNHLGHLYMVSIIADNDENTQIELALFT